MNQFDSIKPFKILYESEVNIMARTKWVTRNVTTYYWTVKAFNNSNDTVGTVTVRTTVKDEKAVKEKFFEDYDPALFVILKVELESEDSAIFGMTEDEFMTHAVFIKTER